MCIDMHTPILMHIDKLYINAHAGPQKQVCASMGILKGKRTSVFTHAQPSAGRQGETCTHAFTHTLAVAGCSAHMYAMHAFAYLL